MCAYGEFRLQVVIFVVEENRNLCLEERSVVYRRYAPHLLGHPATIYMKEGLVIVLIVLMGIYVAQTFANSLG